LLNNDIMNIRIATEEDIAHLVQLHGERDETHYRGFIKEMSRGESVLLIAEENSAVIGQVGLRYYGIRHINHPVMIDLRVSQHLQGQGIGTELIGVCEHLAAVRGFNIIGITVNPTLNARARRLYERLGYIPINKQAYMDGQVYGQENWVIDMAKRIQPII